MSFDRLIRKIVETKNPTVVGLDPKLEYIPEELKAEAYAKYGKTWKALLKPFSASTRALSMPSVMWFPPSSPSALSMSGSAGRA